MSKRAKGALSGENRNRVILRNGYVGLWRYETVDVTTILAWIIAAILWLAWASVAVLMSYSVQYAGFAGATREPTSKHVLDR